MNKQVKETFELAERYSDKITLLTEKVIKATQSLSDAREDYKIKRWWTIVLNWLLTLISIIIVLLLLSLILQHTCPNPLDIKFQGLEVIQHCTQKK